MKNEITINGQTLPIREYNGVRVVTFKDIDTVHKRPEGTARRNFNSHKSHFIEGEDFYKLSPDEFRTAIGKMDLRQKNDVILITETGYLTLVKSFTDDLAWEVQRDLVNKYFKAKEQEKQDVDMSEVIAELIGQMLGEEMVHSVASVVLESIMPSISDFAKRIDALEKRVSALESGNRPQSESKTTQTANTLLIGAKTQNNVTYISEHYGMTAIEMNDLLAKLGVQFRDNDGVWKLTYEYSANDYVRYRYFDNPDCPRTMYWTRGGLVFLYTFLAERGVYPIC